MRGLLSFAGFNHARIKRWRGSGSGLPGKSQVIWVSIGNKQLDPLPSKKLDTLENVGALLVVLKL